MAPANHIMIFLKNRILPTHVFLLERSNKNSIREVSFEEASRKFLSIRELEYYWFLDLLLWYEYFNHINLRSLIRLRENHLINLLSKTKSFCSQV